MILPVSLKNQVKIFITQSYTVGLLTLRANSNIEKWTSSRYKCYLSTPSNFVRRAKMHCEDLSTIVNYWLFKNYIQK